MQPRVGDVHSPALRRPSAGTTADLPFPLVDSWMRSGSTGEETSSMPRPCLTADHEENPEMMP